MACPELSAALAYSEARKAGAGFNEVSLREEMIWQRVCKRV
jgi:hypothetical protein